jgi:hypothetical protein
MNSSFQEAESLEDQEEEGIDGENQETEAEVMLDEAEGTSANTN